MYDYTLMRLYVLLYTIKTQIFGKKKKKKRNKENFSKIIYIFTYKSNRILCHGCMSTPCDWSFSVTYTRDKQNVQRTSSKYIYRLILIQPLFFCSSVIQKPYRSFT